MTTVPDRVLFATDLVRIGAFRCGPDHAAFTDSGAIENCCFVFPRTSVIIEHDHERPFVANPNVVTFYNHRDRYRREAIARDGDRCDWYAVRHDVALEIANSIGRFRPGSADQPFTVTHAPSDSSTYVFQRHLFRTITRGEPPEPLAVEESVIWLLERVLRSAEDHDARSRPLAETRRIDLVHDAKTMLSRQFLDGMTLLELARSLDVSVFHLCRVFRRLAGWTLHEYRHQLRLRWSLERLTTRPTPSLVECALAAGFSSQSHYGAAFKRSFGQTPSGFVRTAAGPRRFIVGRR